MTTPPTQPGPLEKPRSDVSGLEQYNRVAETVGMVPSLRKFDYLFQGSCVVVGAIVGTGIGWFFPEVFDVVFRQEVHWDPEIGAPVGGLVGFIVMGLLSGLVLMLLGWLRAMKK